MIYVVNDMHGSKKLVDKVIKQMHHLNSNDTLIINGDGAGARGPIMNNLVRIFYEVRREESPKQELLSAVKDIIGDEPNIPDAWIYDTVHAGLFRKLLAEKYEVFNHVMEKEIYEALEVTIRPLSEVAKLRGIRVVYLPGNGEIAPTDFSTKDITREISVIPEHRLFNRIAKDGYFKQFDIEYVYYAKLIDDTLLLSTHLLDLGLGAVLEKMAEAGALNNLSTISDVVYRVIAHYPIELDAPKEYFDFWTPSKTDIERTETLRNLIDLLSLWRSKFYFGHIHRGSDDPRMEQYPVTKTFDPNSIWVKPGEIIRI